MIWCRNETGYGAHGPHEAREPEAWCFSGEMMLSARVSNYPDHVNKARMSHHLYRKEEDCVMFPKTLLKKGLRFHQPAGGNLTQA